MYRVVNQKRKKLLMGKGTDREFHHGVKCERKMGLARR